MVQTAPETSGCISLIIFILKWLCLDQDQTRISCHGNNLPAVMPCSHWSISWCSALTFTQGHKNLAIFLKYMYSTETHEYIIIYQRVGTAVLIIVKKYMIAEVKIRKLKKICINTIKRPVNLKYYYSSIA